MKEEKKRKTTNGRGGREEKSNKEEKIGKSDWKRRGKEKAVSFNRK